MSPKLDFLKINNFYFLLEEMIELLFYGKLQAINNRKTKKVKTKDNNKDNNKRKYNKETKMQIKYRYQKQIKKHRNKWRRKKNKMSLGYKKKKGINLWQLSHGQEL